MRIRAGLGLLLCCASAAACTAAGPKGPVATVTRPAVRHPAAPASAQAALSAEAFTPYAGLGASVNDGLAPGETYSALHTACMTAAGYAQYAASTPLAIRANRGLSFGQAFGPWGYLGTATAAQQGFTAPTGGTAAQTGESYGPPAGNLPDAALEAAGKCVNIVLDFNDAQFAHALAIVETLNNDIGSDVVTDPAVLKAVKDWSACMARNGFSAPSPNALGDQEESALGLRPGPAGAGPAPAASAGSDQIAAAVADAGCTRQSDLGGIYFAVQAGYEQQLVSANQQALTAAVRHYKAAYARELRMLPALLRTASARPQLPGTRVPSGQAGGAGGSGRTARPAPRPAG